MAKRRFTKRKKGPVQAKKVVLDGITFQSGLEAYMYKALKGSKIKFAYEPTTYVVFEGFKFTSSSYERQSNGKGDFKDRGNKSVRKICYTPDFEGDGWTIECKGRANDTFPMRWKMFKSWVQKNQPGRLLLKPQTQKECDIALEIIKEHIKTKRS